MYRWYFSDELYGLGVPKQSPVCTEKVTYRFLRLGTSAAQSWHEIVFSFSRHEIYAEKCSEISPKSLSLYLQNSRQTSRKISLVRFKKKHRRASAGAQGECLLIFRMLPIPPPIRAYFKLVGREKPINIQKFGGTPLLLDHNHPVDVSHLSRGNVPSVPWTICPIYVELHINQVRTFLSKRVLQSEVLGEVCILEGGQFGTKFLAKFGAKFLAKFLGFFCWDIRSKKRYSKNFSPKVPRLCAAQPAKIEGKIS